MQALETLQKMPAGRLEAKRARYPITPAGAEDIPTNPIVRKIWHVRENLWKVVERIARSMIAFTRSIVVKPNDQPSPKSHYNPKLSQRIWFFIGFPKIFSPLDEVRTHDQS